MKEDGAVEKVEFPDGGVTITFADKTTAMMTDGGKLALIDYYR